MINIKYTKALSLGTRLSGEDSSFRLAASKPHPRDSLIICGLATPETFKGQVRSTTVGSELAGGGEACVVAVVQPKVRGSGRAQR
jgi:hypothetical protein